MNRFGMSSLLKVSEKSADGWSQTSTEGTSWESFYRQRWAHDKVVRSTHGVNCTGSCSWNVYVKDGIITWETQATDYPSNGPDVPDYEPRGCPRGASFSWYIYSPNRVKYPYIRAELLQLYRAERAKGFDPVDAWGNIVEDPEKTKLYKDARGKGGFVRGTWDETIDIAAAAHVYTTKTYGPDRVTGMSPIPAMSMVSYSGGTRFLSLMGGTILSFYDWYADLPPASPQIWGDQTDVPESADWFNAGYLMMWGSNVPITRTPDAHFMTEARYRGQKVVVVSPDYSDHTVFADDWLAAAPGTDGAVAMAMGHVILSEFHVGREVPYFVDYIKRFTDMPMLVTLREKDGSYVSDRFLRASDLAVAETPEAESEHADWKTVVLDAKTDTISVPNGSIGYRWGDDGVGKWNLGLDEVDPTLTLIENSDDTVEVSFPVFSGDGGMQSGSVTRGVPVRRIGDQLVTTVYDLMLAHYGVRREGLPGSWPTGYDDTNAANTPGWQEQHSGVPAHQIIKVAREFARNAERTKGRSMIVMGAGTNHWFHSDTIYRAMLNMLLMCGCEGVNGGGWAHYVGQEKVRPIVGFSQVAFALDWTRPPRHQAATTFWYMNTSQWRYEAFDAGVFGSPLGRGEFEGMHLADCIVQAARMGWMPQYPSLNRNPLDIADDAAKAGMDVSSYIVEQLKSGDLDFAVSDPDAPENEPRVLTVWRANVIGDTAKGHEYFLKHLLGVTTSAVRNPETEPENRPEEVVWHDEARTGKLDLLMTLDFRMNGTTLHSDIVLPAATWYEKHDISTTDMHPFVHPFNPAIASPWEARSDWDAFKALADRFSELAVTHLGTRTDVVMAPLLHDSSDEIAQPLGHVKDWKSGECDPIPGVTMPKFIAVERDFTAVGERMTAIGPLLDTLGETWKGVTWKPDLEVEHLGKLNGRVVGGPADGRPAMRWADDACEAILALSGTTNGRLAVQGFETLGKRVGRDLAGISADREDERITFETIQNAPNKVIASAEWSGLEGHDRRYSPFTSMVEFEIPWRTLTGRQQFYVDHQWMLEYGEGLAIYRPPVNLMRHIEDPKLNEPGRPEVMLRYLTPHSKWSIHSTYQDNLTMLTLSRGGPAMWLAPDDAEAIGVSDNDWLEAFNRNGVFACRAIVSHRIPKGTSIVYHAQDRHINVPITEISKTRGGIHNSLTRISIKPTHLIGAYAQLSYGFNYYGPTGNQRDELVVVRKRLAEVTY